MVSPALHESGPQVGHSSVNARKSLNAPLQSGDPRQSCERGRLGCRALCLPLSQHARGRLCGCPVRVVAKESSTCDLGLIGTASERGQGLEPARSTNTPGRLCEKLLPLDKVAGSSLLQTSSCIKPLADDERVPCKYAHWYHDAKDRPDQCVESLENPYPNNGLRKGSSLHHLQRRGPQKRDPTKGSVLTGSAFISSFLAAVMRACHTGSQVWSLTVRIPLTISLIKVARRSRHSCTTCRRERRGFCTQLPWGDLFGTHGTHVEAFKMTGHGNVHPDLTDLTGLQGRQARCLPLGATAWVSCPCISDKLCLTETVCDCTHFALLRIAKLLPPLPALGLALLRVP